MSTFLNTLAGARQYREVITPSLKQLTDLMSNDDFQGIPQLEIDYNLIEVQPLGMCFSIKEKMFVESPLSGEKIGQVSPRTFVYYNYDPQRPPNPKQ